MRIPSEPEAILKVRTMLSELADLRFEEVREPQIQGHFRPDAILQADSYTFIVEWVRSGSLGLVAAAANQLRAIVKLDTAAIPLIAAPYMGEAARTYCEDAGIAWLDLSGNARISAPGIRIHVLGQRNQFIRPGRPENAFEPKASRIARWLLMHPGQSLSQRAMAVATGLNEGHTSRVIKKLVDDRLVVRDGNGIRVPHPERLLDAWREVYRFDKHSVTKGHITALTGDEIVRVVAEKLPSSVPYAVTGLAAAWIYTQHAAFRLATIYFKQPPSKNILELLSFREEPRGANTWLVVPNDDGVFHGARELDRTHVVHPVQAYLDLKGHPERADEAAQELRSRLLHWSSP